jgi:hypothetical protein
VWGYDLKEAFLDLYGITFAKDAFVAAHLVVTLISGM